MQKLIKMVCIGSAFITLAYGQTATTTTTVTTRGTIREFSPNVIAVTTDSSAVPVRYTYTKTTTYVDENGNPVSIKTVRSGLPVTVYYDREGTRLVATKVILRKPVTTESTTTTTTAVQQPLGPPSVNGTISSADSEDITILSSDSSAKVHYRAKDATAYVDENGNPVSKNMITEGVPVTIFYERDGDSLVATRVMVRNSLSTEPSTQIIKERTTTVTPAQ